FLDNLSTLASGVAQSEADDWEKLQSWLPDLRRRKIAQVIFHHAGTSGRMRGTTRREDASFWSQKLEVNVEFAEAGCSFIQRFEKNRNAPRDPAAHVWTFKPVIEPKTVQMRIEIAAEPCTLETLSWSGCEPKKQQPEL